MTSTADSAPMFLKGNTVKSKWRRLFLGAIIAALSVTPLAAQRPRTVAITGTELVVTAPTGAIIWVSRLRYGKVPDSGILPIKNLKTGFHTLRARLKGKQDVTRTFSYTSGTQQDLTVKFTAAARKAELHFQIAEELRESGKHKEAIKEYRQALALSKRGYASARIGLARSLSATEEYDKAIAEARRAVADSGGRNGEAYTIIANTRRFQGLADQAIIGYQTALEQMNNFSPEAHTGLALTYQDRNRPDDAIKHFKIASNQSNDTEPIIYFLMGGALEREWRMKEALAAYEKFLELEPTGRQSNATRSIIKQLRKEVLIRDQ